MDREGDKKGEISKCPGPKKREDPKLYMNTISSFLAKLWGKTSEPLGMKGASWKVVSIKKYGAFVRIQPPGVDFEADGFLHISKLQAAHVSNVRSVINEGDTALRDGKRHHELTDATEPDSKRLVS